MLVRGIFLCMILAAGARADAAYYFQRIGNHFVAGNVMGTSERSPIPVRAVFFTPTPAYRRAGYECRPLAEVAMVAGRPTARLGTVCKAATGF